MAPLGKPFSIHQQAFPIADPAALEVATVGVAIQIDGRARGLVQLGRQASQAEALHAARDVEAAAEVFDQTKLKRVVYVPGRILNLVTDA
ncbi:MAG: hypothetical protein ACR2IK_17760 [Chloroflexota bacterium]